VFAALREFIVGGSIEDNLNFHFAHGQEPSQLLNQALSSAGLVGVPPDGLRHDIVAVNKVRHWDLSGTATSLEILRSAASYAICS
jgi:hypothetical protein